MSYLVDDLPVLPLFHAISDLQYYQECSDEVEALTRKLEECFSFVEERDGKKKVGTLAYHPNGLCEYLKPGYSYGSDMAKIVLSPWESSYQKPEEEEDKAKGFPLQVLDNFTTAWKVQIAKALKRRVMVEKRAKFPLQEVKKKWDIYSKLDEEAKKLVEANAYFDDLRHNAYSLKNSFEINTWRFRTNNTYESPGIPFFFLNDEEIEKVISLFEKHCPSKKKSLYAFQELLAEFFKQDVFPNTKGRVYFNIPRPVYKHYARTIQSNRWDRESGGYIPYTYEQAEDMLDAEKYLPLLEEAIEGIKEDLTDNMKQVLKIYKLL